MGEPDSDSRIVEKVVGCAKRIADQRPCGLRQAAVRGGVRVRTRSRVAGQAARAPAFTVTCRGATPAPLTTSRPARTGNHTRALRDHNQLVGGNGLEFFLEAAGPADFDICNRFRPQTEMNRESLVE